MTFLLIPHRTEVVAKLRSHGEELRGLGVRSLGLLGSVARDEASATSDVHVLVEFEGPATLDSYLALKARLEELLGRTVDLVMTRGLKPPVRPHVERDLVRVA